MQEKYFFRIYELRKKFRYLIHTNSQKNKIAIDLLSCITEKFNVFHILRVEAENDMRFLYAPIDMIFDLAKHRKIKIYCFFSTENHLACRSTYNETKNKIRHGRAFQCYYCCNYYIRKNRYSRLMKNWTAILRIL